MGSVKGISFMGGLAKIGLGLAMGAAAIGVAAVAIGTFPIGVIVAAVVVFVVVPGSVGTVVEGVKNTMGEESDAAAAGFMGSAVIVGGAIEGMATRGYRLRQRILDPMTEAEKKDVMECVNAGLMAYIQEQKDDMEKFIKLTVEQLAENHGIKDRAPTEEEQVQIDKEFGAALDKKEKESVDANAKRLEQLIDDQYTAKGVDKSRVSDALLRGLVFSI